MLSIYLLGPLAVETTEGVISLRYNKARALLAYLAMEAGFHTRETLAFLLWPDASVQAGREKLKRMLFELKEALGGDFLEGNRDVLRMRSEAGIWTDIAAFNAATELVQRGLRAGVNVDFEQMAQAAALYRGPFLQGLELEDAPDFSNWVQVRREQCLQSFLHAIRCLAEGHERDGELHAAIDRARQLTVAAPLADAHWQYLLQLLIKAGQPERARQEFEHYCHVLDVELGAEPDESVRRVLEAPRPERVTPVRPAARPAERRQVTVVSCEFEACGEPEDVAEAVNAETVRCEAILRQALAHTVRTPSGGLLAYFGYPVALEGAAQRAVAAAIACRSPIDDSLCTIQTDTRAQYACVEVYTGIHTGLVICSDDVPDVGGTVSRHAMQVGSIVGGGVMLSDATRRLLGATPEAVPTGRLYDRSQGKYFDTFRVVGSLAGTKPPVRHEHRFCGRQRELNQLRTVWRDDDRHVCLVTGEAGLGKSFLLEHFIALNQIECVFLKCSSELRQMPFHPFVKWLEELQNGRADQQLGESVERVANLLRVSGAGIVTNFSTANAREGLVRELYRLIERALPVGGVLCCDDVHWADPSTREILAMLVEKPLPRRSLIITARPEFIAPWRHSTHVEELSLQPLGDEDIVELVRSVAGGNALNERMQSQIVELSEGVPLYAEELTREVVADCGALGDRDKQVEDGTATLLPRSLNDLLMSRIDGVGAVKPIAQFAAAAGTEFTIDLLHQAMDESRAELIEAIAILLRYNLIVRLDDKRYMFRHALLREAAYQSQPKSLRLEAHRRLARALSQDQQVRRNSPELLAWHYVRAGDPRLALEYSLLAARNAAAKSAYREAVGYYRLALDSFKELDESTDGVMRELNIRMELGIQLCALQGYGSAETVDTFRTALALAQPLGDDPRLFPVYWGLWKGASSWADYGMTEILSRTLLRLAQSANDLDLLPYAFYARGYASLFQGKFRDAIEELEKGVSAYVPDHASLTLGDDALTLCLGTLCVAYWYAGRFDDALKASEDCISHSRLLGHRYSLGSSLLLSAGMYRMRGDCDKVDELCNEAGKLAQELGTPLFKELVLSLQGWTKAARGRPDGVACIESSVRKITGIMSGLTPLMIALWAEACDLAGDLQAGLQAVSQGRAAIDETQDVHHLSELQRLKGKFLSEQGAPPRVYRPWLERALATAQRMESPPLILRALLGLLRHTEGPASRDHLELIRKTLMLVQGGDDQWEVRSSHELLGQAGLLRPAHQSC